MALAEFPPLTVWLGPPLGTPVVSLGPPVPPFSAGVWPVGGAVVAGDAGGAALVGATLEPVVAGVAELLPGAVS